MSDQRRRGRPDAAADEIRSLAHGAAGWAELAERITTCTACPRLVAGRRGVVVGAAPPGAELLLVGEAPGAAEDEVGQPFVGRSGQLLDRLLADVGLDRAAAAVLNVLKCRPPGNRPPAAAEIERCRGWLDRQVGLLDPVLTVALGGTATAWALGPTARIATARGRVHLLATADHPAGRTGRPVIVTYHPSAAIRFGATGAPMTALREDLAFAAAELTARRAARPVTPARA